MFCVAHVGQENIANTGKEQYKESGTNVIRIKRVYRLRTEGRQKKEKDEEEQKERTGRKQWQKGIRLENIRTRLP